MFARLCVCMFVHVHNYRCTYCVCVCFNVWLRVSLRLSLLLSLSLICCSLFLCLKALLEEKVGGARWQAGTVQGWMGELFGKHMVVPEVRLYWFATCCYDTLPECMFLGFASGAGGHGRYSGMVKRAALASLANDHSFLFFSSWLCCVRCCRKM